MLKNHLNDQNTSEISKMTKIPLKSIKWSKYPRNLNITKIPPKPKNGQNTPKTQKMTKIPSNPKIDQNTLETQKNDQNTPET